ncbi:Hypothetical_protein [Hexamita inflata]|uniref:Hypothetical_protein n=1 Tax=Hexamita inflata TaxID=28002 RepID=A0AA86V0N6_9EUKA|nr:Hypothetical protein HINF_LOCUS59536 [Hexamita inflata]
MLKFGRYFHQVELVCFTVLSEKPTSGLTNIINFVSQLSYIDNSLQQVQQICEFLIKLQLRSFVVYEPALAKTQILLITDSCISLNARGFDNIIDIALNKFKN